MNFKRKKKQERKQYGNNWGEKNPNRLQILRNKWIKLTFEPKERNDRTEF